MEEFSRNHYNSVEEGKVVTEIQKSHLTKNNFKLRNDAIAEVIEAFPQPNGIEKEQRYLFKTE